MNIRVAEIGEKRLEKVLIKDKKENPKQILKLLRSDLSTLFENYMEIKNLNLNFDIVESVYELKIDVQAKRLKNFGCLPE
ncbi:MAG: cell division topological specificity factor MinE [Clostridia bacterium]|nr:cell division topological specificity factor MinE [Clostridia bacterium]